jgi:hypothetical protein
LVCDTDRFLQDATQFFVYRVTLVRAKPDLVSLDVAFEHAGPREQREFTPHCTGLGVGGAGNFTEVEVRAGMEKQKAQDLTAIGAEKKCRRVGKLYCSHLGDDRSLNGYT